MIKGDHAQDIIGAKVLDDEYYSLVEIYGKFQADDYMNDEFADPSIEGWRVPVDRLEV